MSKALDDWYDELPLDYKIIVGRLAKAPQQLNDLDYGKKKIPKEAGDGKNFDKLTLNTRRRLTKWFSSYFSGSATKITSLGDTDTPEWMKKSQTKDPKAIGKQLQKQKGKKQFKGKSREPLDVKLKKSKHLKIVGKTKKIKPQKMSKTVVYQVQDKKGRIFDFITSLPASKKGQITPVKVKRRKKRARAIQRLLTEVWGGTFRGKTYSGRDTERKLNIFANKIKGKEWIIRDPNTNWSVAIDNHWVKSVYKKYPKWQDIPQTKRRAIELAYFMQEPLARKALQKATNTKKIDGVLSTTKVDDIYDTINDTVSKMWKERPSKLVPKDWTKQKALSDAGKTVKKLTAKKPKKKTTKAKKPVKKTKGKKKRGEADSMAVMSDKVLVRPEGKIVTPIRSGEKMTWRDWFNEINVSLKNMLAKDTNETSAGDLINGAKYKEEKDNKDVNPDTEKTTLDYHRNIQHKDAEDQYGKAVGIRGNELRSFEDSAASRKAWLTIRRNQGIVKDVKGKHFLKKLPEKLKDLENSLHDGSSESIDAINSALHKLPHEEQKRVVKLMNGHTEKRGKLLLKLRKSIDYVDEIKGLKDYQGHGFLSLQPLKIMKSGSWTPSVDIIRLTKESYNRLPPDLRNYVQRIKFHTMLFKEGFNTVGKWRNETRTLFMYEDPRDVSDGVHDQPHRISWTVAHESAHAWWHMMVDRKDPKLDGFRKVIDSLPYLTPYMKHIKEVKIPRLKKGTMEYYNTLGFKGHKRYFEGKDITDANIDDVYSGFITKNYGKIATLIDDLDYDDPKQAKKGQAKVVRLFKSKIKFRGYGRTKESADAEFKRLNKISFEDKMKQHDDLFYNENHSDITGFLGQKDEYVGKNSPRILNIKNMKKAVNGYYKLHGLKHVVESFVPEVSELEQILKKIDTKYWHLLTRQKKVKSKTYNFSGMATKGGLGLSRKEYANRLKEQISKLKNEIRSMKAGFPFGRYLDQAYLSNVKKGMAITETITPKEAEFVWDYLADDGERVLTLHDVGISDDKIAGKKWRSMSKGMRRKIMSIESFEQLIMRHRKLPSYSAPMQAIASRKKKTKEDSAASKKAWLSRQRRNPDEPSQAQKNRDRAKTDVGFWATVDIDGTTPVLVISNIKTGNVSEYVLDDPQGIGGKKQLPEGMSPEDMWGDNNYKRLKSLEDTLQNSDMQIWSYKSGQFYDKKGNGFEAPFIVLQNVKTGEYREYVDKYKGLTGKTRKMGKTSIPEDYQKQHPDVDLSGDFYTDDGFTENPNTYKKMHSLDFPEDYKELPKDKDGNRWYEDDYDKDNIEKDDEIKELIADVGEFINKKF